MGEEQGVAVTPEGLAELATIRSHFPALERQHAGREVAYFDGPGGTQVPREVIHTVTDYLTHHNANTHWAYPSSAETDAIIEEARAALADLVGGKAAEIVFGANMTTLTFHLARALGRRWSTGDEIVVTELDHHANIAPWRALEPESGVVVRSARMRNETGRIDMDHLAACVTPRTRLIAVGGASNALGTINDLEAVVEIARDADALFFVDAVHSIAHVPTDVARIGCDFLACSPYKFYGPHLGVLWGRHALLSALDVPRLDPAPDTAPERLETGTLAHENIAGAATAVGFLASLAHGEDRRQRVLNSLAALHVRGMALFTHLWERFAEIPRVRLYGPPPDSPRTPTLAFTIDGQHAADVARALADRHGLFLSHGDFYAATVVDRLGLRERGGLVRAGLACYTSPDEVDRLIEGVRAIASA